MADHLIVIAIVAFVAYGAHIVMQEGMILYGLANLLKMVSPKFLHKPLFDCPPCMCSIWGALVWLGMVLGLDLGFPLWLFPIHILAAAGVAAYLNR